MKRFEKHIFICENIREEGDPRGCCGRKNSHNIKEEFKRRLKELGISSKIRANSAGCLDACEYGPIVVVYPEQVWYGNVTVEDVDEIIESHLLNNIIVERLLIKDKRFWRDLA